MTVRAMGPERPIALPERSRHAHRTRFLPDRQVTWTTGFAARDKIGDVLFRPPNQDHPLELSHEALARRALEIQGLVTDLRVG
jgi:hypothetical protein